MPIMGWLRNQDNSIEFSQYHKWFLSHSKIYTLVNNDHPECLNVNFTGFPQVDFELLEILILRTRPIFSSFSPDDGGLHCPVLVSFLSGFSGKSCPPVPDEKEIFAWVLMYCFFRLNCKPHPYRALVTMTHGPRG